MEPPDDDSPTIPMLPPRDGASQSPRPPQFPPQRPEAYPPAPAWPMPQPQPPYPFQMAPYTPRVRQPLAGAGHEAGSSEHHRHPAHRMPRIQAMALAGRLKRWSIGLAVAAFVAFVGLAAGHITGVTAAQANPAATPNTNSSQQNNGGDGGFFGGQQNNGNNGGGFFGSGGSGSPSSGTSVS